MKKLVKATGAENYNVLQNNGRIAHQEVDHVHFHMVSLYAQILMEERALGMGKLMGLIREMVDS